MVYSLMFLLLRECNLLSKYKKRGLTAYITLVDYREEFDLI